MALRRNPDDADARAVVEIVCDGDRAGTGFFVGPRIVLTCDHVLVPRASIRVRLAGGEERRARVMHGLSRPDMDVAVLAVQGDAPATVPLTMAAPQRGDAVWTTGFAADASIFGALPSSGTIEGQVTGGTGYEVPHRTYRLPYVFRVRDLRADFGLSGAPVLAMPEGVAIALTIAKYRTNDNFIVPLAALHGTRLGALLAEHSRTTPLFGRYLNETGARLLCAGQRSAAVERLADSRQYLRQRYVARQPLEATIASFLEQTERPVLPIIGPSGVGKSSVLAHLAEDRSRPFLVLLAGYRVRVDGGGGSVRDIVEAELRETARESFDVDRLAHVAADAGAPLVVVFDALNEAAGTVADWRPWLERTLVWLASSRAMLIVSAREEFWSQVGGWIPDRFVYGERGGPSLQDFSPSELRAAVVAYGLVPRLASQPTLRRPVFLRLYADIRAKVPGRVSHARLMQAYVADKTRAVALRMQPPVPSSSIESRLERIAARADHTLALEKPAVYDDVRPEVVQGLLSENVLLETETAFRFLFDEVCEYLMSKAVAFPTSERAWDQWRPASWGAVRFAILRLEITDVEDARRILRLAGAVAQRSHAPYGHVWRELLVDTFSRMASPPVEWMREYLHAAAGEIEDYEQLSIVPAIEAAALRVPERLETLRAVAAAQNYWPWREGDWRYDPDWARHDEIYACAIRRAFDEDAAATIKSLVEHWLPDGRRLRDDGNPTGPARVSHIAEAMLYEQRAKHLDAIYDALAPCAASGEAAHDILRIIGQDSPAAVQTVLDRWADDDPKRDAAATIVIGALASREVDISPWSEYLRRIAESGDRSVSARATELLARIPSEAAAAFANLERRFLGGDPSVRIDHFDAFARSVFPAYFELAQRVVRDPARAWEVRSVLGTLRHLDRAAKDHERIADLLEACLDRLDVRYETGATIVTELEDVDAGTPVFQRLVDLARRFVTSGNSDGRSRIFAFVSTNAEKSKRQARYTLADAIIDGVTDRRDLARFCIDVATQYRGDGAMLERILDVADRLDKADLFFEVVHNKRFMNDILRSGRTAGYVDALRQLLHERTNR